MDKIIRNWVISDMFQITGESLDGNLYLTRPGLDFDVAVYFAEMKTLKCRGTQEQLEELGFEKVGSATATKSLPGGKVEVIAVNYYKGNLLFGNFYYQDITVYLEGPADRLLFYLPGNRLFTAIQADLVHRTAVLTMETNYINVGSVFSAMNQAAESEMEASAAQGAQ